MNPPSTQTASHQVGLMIKLNSVSDFWLSIKASHCSYPSFQPIIIVPITQKEWEREGNIVLGFF